MTFYPSSLKIRNDYCTLMIVHYRIPATMQNSLQTKSNFHLIFMHNWDLSFFHMKKDYDFHLLEEDRLNIESHPKNVQSSGKFLSLLFDTRHNWKGHISKLKKKKKQISRSTIS